MKKNLGKIVIFLLFLQTIIHAQDLASYSLHVSKTKAYIKEPIEISFQAQQLDHTNIMYFFLEPKKSDDYKIVFLTKKILSNDKHNSSALFKYILFPLKSKKIELHFNFTVKTATERGVAQAFVTDHDEGSGLELTSSAIPVKPIELDILALDHSVSIVGDFTLQSKIDKSTIKEYENINLTYTLEGSGYFEKNQLLDKINNVTIFSYKNTLKNRLSPSGYILKREYLYSLSAKQNFTIPAINIKAYSPQRGQYYTIKAPAYNINVEAIKPETLLDKEENPYKEALLSKDTIENILIYIFIFFSGYISAKLRENTLHVKSSKREQFLDIKESKSAMELILVLLKNYKERNLTDEYIDKLEKLTSDTSKKREFLKIKKELLSLM